MWLVVGGLGIGHWLLYVAAMAVLDYPADGTVDLALIAGLAALARAQELGERP